jgi:hypothetical protein
MCAPCQAARQRALAAAKQGDIVGVAAGVAEGLNVIAMKMGFAPAANPTVSVNPELSGSVAVQVGPDGRAIKTAAPAPDGGPPGDGPAKA